MVRAVLSPLSRRSALCGLVVLSRLMRAAGSAAQSVQVYKTPTCGCCGKWVTHMKENGFDVTVTDVPNTAPYRLRMGVPDRLASCHTAVVGKYAIEGHVPASDVQRLLRQQPAKAKGIAVPGMPVGSPGMEQGSARAAYSVLLFNSDGTTSVFRQYDAR